MSELWKNKKTARAATAEQVEALLDAFDANDDKHIATWLSLSAEERRSLLENPHKKNKKWMGGLPHAVMCLAYNLLQGDSPRPLDAITIYDDLVELSPKAQVSCWKNALWAIMPDNTGVPLDRKRCLHYLERCAPHTATEDTFWHIACIHKHLGDIDACIDALAQAKAQGDKMAGPRDEPFFRELWNNERFAALFEDIDPPLYTIDKDGDDTIEDIPNPLVVRNLSLGFKKKIPERLREFKNLEILRLQGELTALPEWLTELTKLRKLWFWCGKLKKIPDAVLCMPSLEEFERYSGLPRGYNGAAIQQLLKSFQKNDVPADARPVHLGLLVGRSAKGVTDAQLVEALGSTATKVHRKALFVLEKRWKKRSCALEEGAEIVVLGKLSADRGVLKERLERLGVRSKKKMGKKTAAIVIGPRHGGKALELLDGTVPVVLETHLHAELDRKDERHFDGASPEEVESNAETAAQLSELLLAVDESSVSMALEMIKRGGLPGGLLEELLLVAQNPDLGKKTRSSAKTLFERYATADSVQAVQSQLKRTNIFASGETKLARRLDAIQKKSGGELDGHKIALAMFKRSKDGLKYLLKKAKSGAPKVELLAAAQTGSELVLHDLELTRIPDEVGELKNLLRIDAQANRINRLTSGLFELSTLQDLQLGNNALRDIPPEIAQLESLRNLGVSENLFTCFPASILTLGNLQELNFSSDTYSYKMKMPTINADLSALLSLKTLILRGHSFEELPESIKELDKLESLQLGWGKLGVFPKWLLEMPALTTLEVQYLRLPDEASLVLDALQEKGVKVMH